MKSLTQFVVFMLGTITAVYGYSLGVPLRWIGFVAICTIATLAALDTSKWHAS
jgi:hypothetical protein